LVERSSIFVEGNYTKVRIIFFFDPSTLTSARNHYKHLVMMVLLNNGHGEPGANTAFAFGADCEKVDGVLHGLEGEEGLGGEPWRLLRLGA
jgi:hypothetical protein